MKFDTTYQHKNLKTNSNETIPMSNLNLIRQSNDKLHLELFKKLNTPNCQTKCNNHGDTYE